MDTTDLQKLIEVIAASLNDGAGRAPGTNIGGIAEELAALSEQRMSLAGTERNPRGDAGGVVAQMVAGMPGTAATPAAEAATTWRAPASDAEDGPLARVARSLVTGLGVISLVKGVFGGQDSAASSAPALPKFQLPASVAQEIAYSSRTGGYVGFDRSEAGAVRPREATPAAVTVNVQALDSRSFIDHSHEIARAVRAAMLNSNSLNDVVSEL
jgi:hypothetical protein